MMPFIELTTIHLGPLPIQPFGLLVATGVLVGTSLGAKYARDHNYSEDALRFMGMRAIVFGFIFCHLLDVFFYTPGKVLKDPLVILRVWEGIASYGGILGATLAFTFYASRIHCHFLRYGDAVVYGFVPGFTFGRMGCATAHDHLGQQTDFFLGVHLPKLNRCPQLKLPDGSPDFKAMAETMGCANWKLPDGTAHVMAHDLGLYEVFICSFLFLILVLVARFWKTRRPGTIIVIAALYYAPIRFMLDFLRFPENDPHYLGLTPAQHLCIWTVIGGLVTLNAMRKPYNKNVIESDEERAAITLPEIKAKGATSKSSDETKASDKPKGQAKVVRKKRK